MNRITVVLLALAGAAVAAPAAAAGDAAKGRELTAMCSGCHGIEGYKTTFPKVYQVPKLGGQYPEYIVSALKEYKSGERSHPSMKAIAAGLSEEQMGDLAAYYGQAK